MEKTIEIPFGAHDSELKGWEYTIPEDMEAEIKDGKVIVREKESESEDEKIMKELLEVIRHCYEDGGYALCTDDYKKYSAYLEKQKEQKSAEWSEEDEKKLNRIINVLDELGFEEYCKSSRDQDVEEERLYYDEIQLLKKLKSLRPQPKQEVVDRTVFDRIADILRWCDLPIGCPVENFKESESEREHLLNIVQCVAHRYANSCAYCKEYSRGYQDGLNVHRWKPSEEQMKALQSAIVFVEIRKASDYDISPLKELYEQLKKL